MSIGIPIVERIDAAIDWILVAREASDDGGISKGYHVLRRRWAPSYPETTGYTIPTLLNAAALLDRPALRPVASSLADYLRGLATPEGGVTHWAAPGGQPIVFDTGQVIFGWLASYDATGNAANLAAAIRAGDWLVRVQDASGCWGQHQYLGVTKVIDARVSWALLELHQRTNRDEYRQAGIRSLDWVVAHQESDGWFRRCAFVEGDDPSTHALAYTAEGLLESGRILGIDRFVRSGRLTADALLARQRSDGALASTYSFGWRPTSRSSCLTGNCQTARLWLRLKSMIGGNGYLESARRAVDFVADKQRLDAKTRPIRGAIGGSHPLYGRYERFAYPNWAAKFFVDAALSLRTIDDGVSWPLYAG